MTGVGVLLGVIIASLFMVYWELCRIREALGERPTGTEGVNAHLEDLGVTAARILASLKELNRALGIDYKIRDIEEREMEPYNYEEFEELGKVRKFLETYQP